ncbi:MAG: right-handed parallel beta-helix repeat-containing protein [Candidatus Gottesmanbacteria bacterium]|nr:right-handed parallel beta-helix repeat-containing protein [Candidatus Gottesmanbacteria bacterium]
MATLYISTGGANTNSGCTDVAAGDASIISGSAATNVGTLVTLDGSPDLSGLVTSGATQSSINLSGATNANKKIFWISAFDNTAKTVTVDTAPTGTLGAWKIGGQWTVPASTGMSTIDAATTFRAGDTIIFNDSPVSASQIFFTARAAGTGAAGPITVKGKTGVRPVITVTSTDYCFTPGNFDLWRFENLEFAQTGASGTVLLGGDTATSHTYYNIKISDGGGVGINIQTSHSRLLMSEVSGVGSGGVQFNNNGSFGLFQGNYIHDVGGNGFDVTTACSSIFINNIIDSAAGRGIYLGGAYTSAANFITINGNTVYGCGDSGLEVADTDAMVTLTNNIFSENGDAAGEYNVEWTAGTAQIISLHGWNVFYHSGGGGGANLLNLTVNAQVASSEFTTDPGFTNAAGGDFSISSTSPAKAAGFPGAFLGGPTGYLDIGAVQRQESTGGGGIAGYGYTA